MSDEAIVRLVIADSTAGARTTDTQSSAAGLSSSTVGGIDPNRLYREIGSASTEINRGFKTSLAPAVSLLGEIRDVLTQDYDYSEKDYKESTTQTSLLRVIGAYLSGDRGAVGREVTKGVGLQTADTQMISALNGINASVRELKLSLSPEAEARKTTLMGKVLTTAALTLGVVELPNILKAMGMGGPINIADKLGRLIDFVEKASFPEAVVAVEQAAEQAPAVAAETIAQSTTPETASLISEVGKGVVDAITSHPGEIAAIAVGAIVGGILYFMMPEKEKEKSTNELLQEIVTGIEGQTTEIKELDLNTEATALYCGAIANYADLIDVSVRDILGLMQQQMGAAIETTVAEHALSDETAAPGYELAAPLSPNTASATGAESAVPDTAIPTGQEEEDPLKAVAAEVQQYLLDNPTQVVPDTKPPTEVVPDTAPPQAEEVVPNTKLPETTLQPVTELHDPWEGWEPAYVPNQFLSQQQLQELGPSGVQPIARAGRFVLNNVGFEQFLQYRERANLGPPEYFASGGAVGSDTVPAMLSPGEVVVPKKMVDGGAVDHLRGKIPGFAGGGLIGTTNRMLMGQMETDPATRIDRFGQGMSAVGDKLMSVGGSLGLVAGPLGAFAVGLGKAAEGVGQLMGVINETVDKYGEYNPQVAMAQAQVEINQTMGDMRRAQELGPDLAKFVVAQGELQQRFEEIKVKLLMQVVPAINNILEVLNKVMGSGEGIGFAIELLTAPLTVISIAARKLVDLQEDARIPQMEDPTNLILKSNIFDTSAEGPGAGSSVPIR